MNKLNELNCMCQADTVHNINTISTFRDHVSPILRSQIKSNIPEIWKKKNESGYFHDGGV